MWRWTGSLCSQCRSATIWFGLVWLLPVGNLGNPLSGALASIAVNIIRSLIPAVRDLVLVVAIGEQI